MGAGGWRVRPVPDGAESADIKAQVVSVPAVLNPGSPCETAGNPYRSWSHVAGDHPMRWRLRGRSALLCWLVLIRRRERIGRPTPLIAFVLGTGDVRGCALALGGLLASQREEHLDGILPGREIELSLALRLEKGLP